MTIEWILLNLIFFYSANIYFLFWVKKVSKLFSIDKPSTFDRRKNDEASATAFLAPAQTGKATTALWRVRVRSRGPGSSWIIRSAWTFDEAGGVDFDQLSLHVEIKHGRNAQLAFLGNIITRAGVRLSGKIDYATNSFKSFPNGWTTVSGPNTISRNGVTEIFAFVVALELFGVVKDATVENEFIGDFRNTAPSTSDGTPSMGSPREIGGDGNDGEKVSKHNQFRVKAWKPFEGPRPNSKPLPPMAILWLHTTTMDLVWLSWW